MSDEHSQCSQAFDDELARLKWLTQNNEQFAELDSVEKVLFATLLELRALRRDHEITKQEVLRMSKDFERDREVLERRLQGAA